MSKPRLTSVDQLGPAKLAREEVEIGGYSVLVWALTGREIQKWSKENATIRGGKVVRLNADTATARLLAAAIRDDTGQRQFSVEDVNQLLEQLSAADLARLEKTARRLSGLDEDEQDDSDDAESEEGAPGGNGFTPRTPSSTVWPVTSDEPAMSS